jgi:hypothetical protein
VRDETIAIVESAVVAMARSLLPLLQIAVVDDLRKLERRVAALEAARPSPQRRHNEISER